MNSPFPWRTVAALVLSLLSARSVYPQSVDDGSVGAAITPAAVSELPPGYVGPPLPVPPAVVTRDPEGRAAVRAVRLAQPLRLDGRLDDELYSDVPPISGFLQMEPQAGAPATERTDLWIEFYDDHIFV